MASKTYLAVADLLCAHEIAPNGDFSAILAILATLKTNNKNNEKKADEEWNEKEQEQNTNKYTHLWNQYYLLINGWTKSNKHKLCYFINDNLNKGTEIIFLVKLNISFDIYADIAMQLHIMHMRSTLDARTW